MFFLYQSVVEEALDKMTRVPVSIEGALGCGKTAVLHAIGRMGTMQMLDGKDYRACLNALTAMPFGSRTPVSVLIDNVDYLLAAPDPVDFGELSKCIQVLTNLVQEGRSEAQRRVRLVLSTTGKFYDPLNPRPSFVRPRLDLPKAMLDDCSRIAPNLTALPLDPWHKEWETSWFQRFDVEFETELKVWPGLDDWKKEILDLTGGHPVLSSVLIQLKEMLAAAPPESPSLPPVYRTLFYDRDLNHQRLVRQHIEDWIDKPGLGLLKSVVRRLRDSSVAQEARAFSELVRGVGIADWYPSKEARDLLSDCGLIRKDHSTGKYSVPGAALRRVIELAGEGIATLRLEPDPGKSSKRGRLVFTRGGVEKEANIYGRAWRVLTCLHHSQGSLLTAAAIQNITGLNERAVQSGIAMLRKELPSGVELVNEHGRGYRLVTGELRDTQAL